MRSDDKTRPTSADFDTLDVHESKAMLAGRDTCSCKTCRRVRAWYEAGGREFPLVSP